MLFLHVLTQVARHHVHILMTLMALLDPTPGQEIDIKKSIINIVNLLAGFAGVACAFSFLRAGYIKIFASDSYRDQAQFPTMIASAIIGLVVCIGAVTLNNLVLSQIVNK